MSTTTTTPIAKAHAQPVAFCATCGAMAPTDAKFCNACGEQLAPTAPRLAAVTTEPSPHTPSPVAPPPSRRFPWKPVAVAGVIVAALGAAGTVFALRPADHSREDARASLRASNAGVGQVVAQLRQAERLGDLRKAGRLAQRQEEALAAEAARLQAIRGKDAGRTALAVIAAERDLLGSVVALGDLDPAHVGDWPQTRARIDAATTRLAVAVRDVEALGPTATLAPAGGAMTATLDADADVVAHANVKLRTWRRAYRRARHAQRRQLAALTAYAAAVNGQLGTYNGLRDDLDQWIDDVGDATIPYGQAFDQLTAAADRRKDVRDALAAINPPRRLAAAHASLLTVLSDAIVAMTDAGDAAQECTADPTCFGEDFRDMPQWQSFSDASRRITSQFAAADQRWQQEIARMRIAIRHRRMPAPPTV
jgi:ribosomal protein L40E